MLSPTTKTTQPTSHPSLPPQTQPEQTPNKPQTNAEQLPNKTQTNAEQNPNTSQTTAGPAPSTDPDHALIEEEIAERTQAKSPLDNLPLIHQQLLYDLLSRYTFRKVKDVIALPSPRGLNITPSLGALFEFKRRYANRSQLQRKREIGLVAMELLNEPAFADDGYVQASERLLRLRLLETINNPASKTAEIRDLYQTLTRLRAQAVAEKRLKLAEQKLQR